MIAEHHHVGMLVFLELHRRILGGKFGRIPSPLRDDAFSMGGYCLDAPELMPAGGCFYDDCGEGLGVTMPLTVYREGDVV